MEITDSDCPRMISLDEARQLLSGLVGTDMGEIDGFLVVAHRPEDDGYLVAGSLACQHCRAGFLIETAMRVIADAPHEHDHPTIEEATSDHFQAGM